MAKRKRPQEEPCDTGGAELKINEDTGKPYWELWGADWKQADDMDDGEAMQLSPDAFPLGTRVTITEPGPDDPRSQEFYDRMFREREARFKRAEAP